MIPTQTHSVKKVGQTGGAEKCPIGFTLIYMARQDSEVVGKPGVGEVLATWMNKRGLNPTDMARMAEISRATVYVVLDSRSKQPVTMRQLARGLARTSVGSDVIDLAIEQEASRDLLTAAGYGSLILEVSTSVERLDIGQGLPEEPPPKPRPVEDLSDEEVVEALTAISQDPELSAAFLAVADNWQSLPPESQAMLLGTLRAAGERHEKIQSNARRIGEMQRARRSPS